MDVLLVFVGNKVKNIANRGALTVVRQEIVWLLLFAVFLVILRPVLSCDDGD